VESWRLKATTAEHIPTTPRHTDETHGIARRNHVDSTGVTPSRGGAIKRKGRGVNGTRIGNEMNAALGTVSVKLRQYPDSCSGIDAEAFPQESEKSDRHFDRHAFEIADTQNAGGVALEEIVEVIDTALRQRHQDLRG